MTSNKSIDGARIGDTFYLNVPDYAFLTQSRRFSRLSAYLTQHYDAGRSRAAFLILWATRG